MNWLYEIANERIVIEIHVIIYCPTKVLAIQHNEGIYEKRQTPISVEKMQHK